MRRRAKIRPYDPPPMDGWFREPDGRNGLGFHRDPSAGYEAMIFIDRGEPIPGQPALLKWRERVPRKQAVEQRIELLKE